jgi:hypothetical protein
MANEVEIQLTVEEKQALVAIGKVIKQIDKLGDEAQRSEKQTSSFMSSFKGNLAAIATYPIKIEDGIVLTCQAHPTTPTIVVDYDDV